MKKPTLMIYIEELRDIVVTGVDPSIEHLRSLIDEISLRRPSKVHLAVLAPLKFLPVKLAGSSPFLYARDDQFALADRVEYGNIFKDTVTILDYTIEGNRLLRPFIEALGLEDRYMSVIVGEKSLAEDPFLDADATKDMKLKAYALFR